MPTSNATNKQIIDCILRHVDLNKAIKLLTELDDIPGNSSFKKSVSSLLAEMKKRTSTK